VKLRARFRVSFAGGATIEMCVGGHFCPLRCGYFKPGKSRKGPSLKVPRFWRSFRGLNPPELALDSIVR